ncbi:MAG: hypothetical protein WBC91_06260, partial [Phototrophicaceae bacterium]
KRAILKLKESGMLTHLPDDLEDIMMPASDVVSDEASPVEVATLEPIVEDDQTIPSRPKQTTPTIGSVDETAKYADEQAQWASVISGWDDEISFMPDPAPSPPTIPSRQASQQQDDRSDIPSTNDDWELPQTDQSAISPAIIANDDEAAITIRRKEIKPQLDDTALTDSREQTPWTLQQFFDGEIDLEQELIKRHPTVPAMTTVKFRTLGMNSGRKVATLSAQDGSSQIIIDADVATKVVQISFTYGSMMTLRYVLNDLPASNRERWLELMRRDKGGLAFLWNEDRWRDDYLVCISREYSTNIFAFSPRNFESAVRLTKTVTQELLDWLEDIWTSEPEPEDDDESPLLTW